MQQLLLPEGGVSVGQMNHAVGGAAGKAAGAVTGDVLSQIAQAMASAADGLLKTLSTFWMNVDIPQLDVASSPVSVIEGDTSWIVNLTAVVCILLAAARMAIRRRGEPAVTMLLGLTRLVVVSAVATLMVETAGKLGDAFSGQLMSSAHLGTTGWSGIISTAALSSSFASGPGMLLIIALLVIFSSLIQLMLMILRVGLLIVLTGTLPLAAAASMSEWGETWWRKHVAWLAAWLLYKPAAALLYKAAFTLTSGHRTAVEVISGFMLLILSVLILPALLKVVVPMTASLGAASSGALALGVAGAAATGAIKVAALGGAGSAGAAAAPSGSSAAATSTDGKAGSPGGAEINALSAVPPGSASDSAERTIAQPAGGDSTAAGARQKPGPPSPVSGGGPGAASDSAVPDVPGTSPQGGSRPEGSASPDQAETALNRAETALNREEKSTGRDPSGAANHGDDEERENGG